MIQTYSFTKIRQLILSYQLCETPA